MINPKFTAVSERVFDFEEECFSLYDQRATVSRQHDIEVTYLDETGHAQRQHLSGEYAGLVQHEIDHLNGVLFVDHVPKENMQHIDVVLSDDQTRLTLAKEMMAYMSAEA